MDTEDEWLKMAREIVEESMVSVRRSLLSCDRLRVVKIKGNKMVRLVDVIAERICLRTLRKTVSSFVFISEESGVETYGKDPRVAVILDPLDGTDCALRGIPICSISLSIHKYETMKTIAAVVGHPFTKRVFYATSTGAFCNNIPLRPSSTKALEEAFIVTYSSKADRLIALTKRQRLITATGMILNYGGPFNIAQVGSGDVDAFIEFAKGFRCVDFASGAYIAERAGAIVTDMSGRAVVVHPDLNHRSTIIATCTPELHRKLLEIIKEASD